MEEAVCLLHKFRKNQSVVKMFKEKNAMKAKMKKLISIKSIPILALALLVVLGTALADSEGDSVTGSGQVYVNLATGSGQGTSTLSIEGEKFDGTVTVTVMPQPDGTFWVIHEFDFGEENTFSTEGSETMMPANGMFVLEGNMEITEGTGCFEDAEGEMSVHGKLKMLEPPNAVVFFKVNGRISR
jgi:hypothetical protein